MKAFPIILMLCIAACSLNAQSSIKTTQAFSLDFDSPKNEYSLESESPTFIKPYLNSCAAEGDRLDCSIKEFISFIKTNISYPSEAQDNQLESKIQVYFSIGENGKIQGLECKGDYVGLFKQEIVSVFERFKSSPLSWEPAQQVDQTVSVPVRFSIDFSL